jgi:hypothetical protein
MRAGRETAGLRRAGGPRLHACGGERGSQDGYARSHARAELPRRRGAEALAGALLSEALRVRPVPGLQFLSARGRRVRAVAVGLLVEEQRGEVAAAWKRAVERELGGEPALAFAVGPLLREMGLALRADRPAAGGDAGAPLRSAVLVRSGAAPARVAREFKLLPRALWETLRASGSVVAAAERRAADEWLDEALAAALDRLDRVRTRVDLLEHEPAEARPARPVAAQPARPPPLPRPGAVARPPPLPVEPAEPYGSIH